MFYYTENKCGFAQGVVPRQHHGLARPTIFGFVMELDCMFEEVCVANNVFDNREHIDHLNGLVL